ncbi:hypothetical protein GO988_21645 [Hymenobacter sp. HMF4947]|uniref:Uncharacterized protein n=1 Tax=Hymenobacter ginkgonis TaxID=2682976 RepID=A0A7K1TKP1_9BACT|nr:hypothetical protein [Hymenobacter ginkgonis]MVN78942.1 hypothetical protein [Hymenobacter ginkgonis]
MSSKPTLSLTLATDQVLHVHMSDPAERLTYENLAKHQLDVDAEKAELRRTYHLGKEATPGRGYDDRLTVRLGLSRSTLMLQLELWRTGGGKTGGLRHAWAGKYVVEEAACREWLRGAA